MELALVIDGTPHELELSSDAKGMLIVMPLLLLAIPALLLHDPRIRSAY